jgi:hypothetical protein
MFGRCENTFPVNEGVKELIVQLPSACHSTVETKAVAVWNTVPLDVKEVVHDVVPLQTLQFECHTLTIMLLVPSQLKGVVKLIVAQPPTAGGVYVTGPYTEVYPVITPAEVRAPTKVGAI